MVLKIETSFSSFNSSWFNLHHLHFSTEQEDQTTIHRLKNLKTLFNTFQSLASQLKSRQTHYQLFAIVHEFSGYNDAVFIHTPNPEEDNFPYFFEKDDSLEFHNPEIEEFIEKQKGFSKFLYRHNEEVFYVLFEKEVGAPVLREKSK